MKCWLWFGSTVLILASSTLETRAQQHTLGKGFYLPARNIIEDSFIGGVNIFEDTLPPECIVQTPDSTGKTISEVTFYKDTKSFYTQIGASLGLSGSVASYFTLSAALKYVAGTESNYAISGSSLNIKSTKGVMALSQNCINTQPLSKLLLEALDRLPKAIEYPKAEVSWDAYATFLNSYGSHFATEVVHGSQLVQWEFSQSSNDYSKKDLTLKACLELSLSSTTSVAGGVGPCAEFSKTDIEQAGNVNSRSRLTVTGGSIETQIKLREKSSRTDEAIARFLKEGKGGYADAIGYQWKALYDILLQRFSGGDRNIKAKNLRMYYEGLKSYGCQLVEDGPTTLREFVLNTKNGDPTNYECRVAGEGCQGDSDCHLVISGKVGCYCYGRTCVENVVTTFHGETRVERGIRRERSGQHNGKVNRSCKLSASCKCEKEKLAPAWQTVWRYESIAKKEKVPSALKRHKIFKKQQDDGKKEEGSAEYP